MTVNEESVRQPSGTAMKPQTAAKKLGIYLPAAPEEFQATAITHAELAKLHTDPLREARTAHAENRTAASEETD